MYKRYLEHYSSNEEEKKAIECLEHEFNLNLNIILSDLANQKCRISDLHPPTRILTLLKQNPVVHGHRRVVVLKRFPAMLLEEKESLYYKALQIGNEELVQDYPDFRQKNPLDRVCEWFSGEPCFTRKSRGNDSKNYISDVIRCRKIHPRVFQTFLSEFINAENDGQEYQWTRQQLLIVFTIFSAYASEPDLEAFCQKFHSNLMSFSDEEWGVVILNAAITESVERVDDLIRKSHCRIWPDVDQNEFLVFSPPPNDTFRSPRAIYLYYPSESFCYEVSFFDGSKWKTVSVEAIQDEGINANSKAVASLVNASELQPEDEEEYKSWFRGGEDPWGYGNEFIAVLKNTYYLPTDVISRELIQRLSLRPDKRTLEWLANWSNPLSRKVIEYQFDENFLTGVNDFLDSPLKLAKRLIRHDILIAGLSNTQTTKELRELLESRLVFWGVNNPDKFLTNELMFHLCFQMFYPPSHLLKTVSELSNFKTMFQAQWFSKQGKGNSISWHSLLARLKSKTLHEFLTIADEKQLFQPSDSDLEAKSDLIMPIRGLDQCYQMLLNYLVANKSTEDDGQNLDRLGGLLDEHLSDNSSTPSPIIGDEKTDKSNEYNDEDDSDEDNSDNYDSDEDEPIVDETTLLGMMTITLQFSSTDGITTLRRYLNVLDRMLSEQSRAVLLRDFLQTHLFKEIRKYIPFQNYLYMWGDWFNKHTNAGNDSLIPFHSNSEPLPERRSLVEHLLQNLIESSCQFFDSAYDDAENSVTLIVDFARHYGDREPSTTELLKLMTGYINFIMAKASSTCDTPLFRTHSKANLILRYILKLVQCNETTYNATTLLCQFFVSQPDPSIAGQLIRYYVSQLNGEIDSQSVIDQLQDETNELVPLIRLARFLIHRNWLPNGKKNMFCLPCKLTTQIKKALEQTLFSQTPTVLSVHQKQRLTCFADLDALMMLELFVLNMPVPIVLSYCMNFFLLRQMDFSEGEHIEIIPVSVDNLEKVSKIFQNKLTRAFSSIAQSAPMPRSFACGDQPIVVHQRDLLLFESEFSSNRARMSFFNRASKSDYTASQQLLAYYLAKTTGEIAIFSMKESLSNLVERSHENQMDLVMRIINLVRTFIFPAVQQFALNCTPILAIQQRSNPKDFYQTQCPPFNEILTRYFDKDSEGKDSKDEENKESNQEKFIKAITSQSPEQLTEVLMDAYIFYHNNEEEEDQASVALTQ